MSLAERYYLEPGAAFVRAQRAPGLENIAGHPDEEVFQAGLDAGLRLHRYKRTGPLPRVKRVLGALQTLAPTELLDIGSGRGVFLWPLLDAFPTLPVTAVDDSDFRAADLDAVARGGVSRLTGAHMDVTQLAFADASFDGVTVLEVLEHLPDPGKAVREVMRVCRRFVIASVPSKEDDNPEHVQLFDEKQLTALFHSAGARRVSVSYVLNHLIAVVLR